MKVINKPAGKRTLELGDVVVSKDAYLVIHDDNGYILRNFNGWTGLTGYHSDLAKLTESLPGKCTVYPSSEYELELKPKS